MRSNSGSGESRNNLKDPTMKEREQERRKSGQAIVGEKKIGGEPDRTRAPDHSHRR